MDDVKQIVKINLMFDFYFELLTTRQQTIMSYYYRDDLSLAEIAEHLSISRGAVHDHIQRTIKILENYEEKLKLIDKFQKRGKIYHKMRIKLNDDELSKLLQELEELD